MYNKNMRIIELDRPAIHKLSTKTGSLFEEASILPYISGEPYMTEKRIIGQASLKDPVYRVMKDYDLDGLKFSFSMLTKSKDIAKVEKWLDKLSKTITQAQVTEMMTKAFVFLNERYK